ncbi:peptide deformylase, partial [Staphylococcus pasteuri]|uniref:peptide deformylase n=1 Tax=Staphylococcus pasteuri TaxID=45972 RepID=UPI001649F677
TYSLQEPYLPTPEASLSLHQSIPPLLHPHNTLTIKAQHIQPNHIKLRLKPYPPILFQHQIDHLNPLIFYHHIHQPNPLTPHN